MKKRKESKKYLKADYDFSYIFSKYSSNYLLFVKEREKEKRDICDTVRLLLEIRSDTI